MLLTLSIHDTHTRGLLPGVVVDVTKAVAASNERNYAITVKELEEWESRHGVIPDGGVVLFRTGWGTKSHDVMEYFGLEKDGKLNFPGKWRVASHFGLFSFNDYS